MKLEEINASSIKKQADKINNEKSNAELSTILNQIDKASLNGFYQWGQDGILMNETIKALKIERGFIVEIGGKPNEPAYNIIWGDIVKSSILIEKKFYKNGFIGKGLISEEEYKKYGDSLVERFDNVSWGGYDTIWSTEFTDVLVVNERGIRGPADWFYLNNEQKWAHGGYISNKETYTNTEFLFYITKILEHNIKYEKDIEKQKNKF